MDGLISRALAAHRVTRSSIWARRFFLLLNLTPPLFVVLTGGREWWVWVYACVVHSALLNAILHPTANGLGPILTRLPTAEKLVWLTIDDGLSADTVEIAEWLASVGVSATFFLIGKNLDAFPEALAAIQRHGHTIGNHTQNHHLGTFWIFSPGKIRREVGEFQSAMNRLQLPSLSTFRCPAGIKNPFLHTVLAAENLTLTGWTVRAFDGVRCDVDKSLTRMKNGLQPGAILLVHEGKMDAEGRPASVRLIQELVKTVRAAGYEFVSSR